MHSSIAIYIYDCIKERLTRQEDISTWTFIYSAVVYRNKKIKRMRKKRDSTQCGRRLSQETLMEYVKQKRESQGSPEG